MVGYYNTIIVCFLIDMKCNMEIPVLHIFFDIKVTYELGSIFFELY